LFNTITESALKKVNNKSFTIMGSDISEDIVRKAQQNVINAKMEDVIKISCVAFENLSPPQTNGVLLLNPPYGERLNQSDINTLYKNIGSTLKKNYSGYTAWDISSNREAIHQVGLHATRKITLYNGALECRFLRYEMYSGTKKKKYATDN
ncbi:MAG: class I SAM-dependent RNA methyltransferase, partial [Bacteroidia bacterium]|nr:class I SAM-dependent RNA methyltransferase [Bacteroidia bacterium]